VLLHLGKDQDWDLCRHENGATGEAIDVFLGQEREYDVLLSPVDINLLVVVSPVGHIDSCRFLMLSSLLVLFRVSTDSFLDLAHVEPLSYVVLAELGILKVVVVDLMTDGPLLTGTVVAVGLRNNSALSPLGHQALLLLWLLSMPPVYGSLVDLENQSLSQLDDELLLLQGQIQSRLYVAFHIHCLVLLCLLLRLFVLSRNGMMNLHEGSVGTVLSEQLVLELAATHQESLEDQVQSFVRSDVVQRGSDSPEEGMSDDSGVLEGPFKQELTQRGLVVNLVLHGLHQLRDVETQEGVGQLG